MKTIIIKKLHWNKKKQKSKIPSPIGNLMLSPLQPLMQLSLLQSAAAGVTAEEIARTCQETNPHITKELVGKLRTSNSQSTNMGLASAIFAQNNIKYALLCWYCWNYFDTTILNLQIKHVIR